MPLVSFIVPIYNSMPYLETCLDSLRNQTVKDIEIICVNDCSPDTSQEYVERIIREDSRVKLVNHSTNKRQGGAWNSGVSIATGTFLSFIDADDWVDLDYCTRINNFDKMDIICARKYYTDNVVTDNIIQKFLDECNNDVCKYQLLNGLSFITNFYKRTFFIESGFAFIENNMYQDFITSILYFKTKRIGIYDKPGYHYRTDNISIQRSMNQNGFWGRLDVAKLEHKLLLELNDAMSYKDEIDYHFYILFYRNTLTRAFYGFSKLNWDIINKVKEEVVQIVPCIKKNRYYTYRFQDYSTIMQLPIILFERFPKPIINCVHLLYIFVRSIVK